MLHIVTLLYRFELLSKVYASIPKHDDIRWHLSIAKKRGIPKERFILEDNRIVLHIVDCKDDDFVTKRNYVFSKIKDGYFYMLDDDTYFFNEVYELYKEYEKRNFRGLIIGNEKIRIYDRESLLVAKPLSDDPGKINIGTGMAISSSDALEHVRWAWGNLDRGIGRDYIFWSKCFAYFGPENVVYSNKIISFHNFFSPAARVRIKKRAWGFTIFYLNMDIYNIRMAKLYDALTGKYHLLKSRLGVLRVRKQNDKEEF